MEQIAAIMNNLKGKLTFRFDIQCPKHQIPLMVHPSTGLDVCPRCETERDTQTLTTMINKQVQEIQKNEKFNTLFYKSIVEDQTIINARFDTYEVRHMEERANRDIVLEAAERFKQGEKFNLILQGKQGTGKSHLAYSTLYQLNEGRNFSCCFISIDAMLRKIKATFNDKESKFTEEYFNNLIATVDFLCLDDLGAETGSMDSEKKATDFVQRILYSATNARQDKATILTTNLDSKKLFSMYDKKLVSRLMKNPKFVIFQDSPDKRISSLPF